MGVSSGSKRYQEIKKLPEDQEGMDKKPLNVEKIHFFQAGIRAIYERSICLH